jgi:CheY-like chemotaxis protein
MDDYLAKPVKPAELREVLSRHFAARRAEESAPIAAAV